MSKSARDNGDTYHDRGHRLVGFGILSILIGAGGLLLGLLHLVASLFAGAIEQTLRVKTDVPSYLSGFVVYAMLGATFVWIGRASVHKRRWVPALMTVLARMWLLCGLIVLLLVPVLARMSMNHEAAAVPDDPGVRLVIQATLLVLAAVPALLLPLAFIWAYRGRDVRKTCEAHDPLPDWTAGSGMSVLGLSVGLAASGALLLPLVVRPVVPLFGWVVTGWPAAALFLAGAAGCLYLARVVFRRRMHGFWGSVLLVLLVGVSTVVTFARVAPVEFYRHLYPAESLALLQGTILLSRSVNIWSAVVMTLAGLWYLAAIRNHFTR